MDMRQEIMVNLNYACLLFFIPIILIIIKLLRPVLSGTSNPKNAKTSSRQIIPQRNPTSPKVDYILSSEFIVGKVFVTLNLILMNQIIFSFFI